MLRHECSAYLTLSPCPIRQRSLSEKCSENETQTLQVFALLGVSMPEEAKKEEKGEERKTDEKKKETKEEENENKIEVRIKQNQTDY